MILEAAFEQYMQDKLLYFAIPVFLLALAGEFWLDRRQHLELYLKRDTKASFWMMFFTAIVEFGPKLLAFALFIVLHEWSPLRDIVGRQWWAWTLLFVLDDFAYYWFHRLNHEVRLFWAGHVPHHSAIKMNFSTAIRQGVGERFHKYFFWMWLPLLGFDPLMIFTAMAINLIYQFWIHTELIGRLPNWFEFIFNTPSHHRVHHASNIRYLDCNHAGALIIWDRIFGTFSKEIPDEAPVYGLTENLTDYAPLNVATHEYKALWRDLRNAKKLSDKLKYLFYAPGWNHNGPDKRAKTLRKQLKSVQANRIG